MGEVLEPERPEPVEPDLPKTDLTVASAWESHKQGSAPARCIRHSHPSPSHVQLYRSLAPRSQVHFVLCSHLPPSFRFPARRRRLHSRLHRTRRALRTRPQEMGRPRFCRLHIRPARLRAHSTRPEKIVRLGLRPHERRRPDFRYRVGVTIRPGVESHSAALPHGPFYGAPTLHFYISRG